MALAPNALFRSDMTMLEPPQNRLSPSQIWPLENPVGTEQVRPQYLTAPDADVVPGVMWGDRMYSPRVAGGLNSAMDIGMGFAGSTGPGGIRAYHGSPHSFERFDASRIGTGEGAQAYGHGLYFAEREGVAKSYRDELSAKLNPTESAEYLAASKQRAATQAELDALHNKMVQDSLKQGAKLDPEWGELGVTPLPHIVEQYKPQWDAATSRLTSAHDEMQRIIAGPRPKGSMYEVNIAADPEHMLHWDKPLKEQPEALVKIGQLVPADMLKTFRANVESGITGGNAYHNYIGSNPAVTSAMLRDAGIPGIRYLDQGSRGAGEGSHNLVVFDDATIEILRKYGLAGLMLGGGAAVGTQGQ